MVSSQAAVFAAISRSRRSCKRFAPGIQLAPPIVRHILATTLRSPSSFNLQPTQIIIVQNADTKQILSRRAMLGAGNQYRVRDCSLLAVFLADREASKRLPRIAELERQHGGRHPNYLAILPVTTSFLLGEGQAATALKQVSTSLLSSFQAMPTIDSIDTWSAKNTAVAAQSFVLAATSHGLATAMMEGYDSRRVRDILRVPDRYSIPIMVAVGTEYQEEGMEDTAPTPRLPIEEVVFRDTFGAPYDADDDDDAEDEETLQEA